MTKLAEVQMPDGSIVEAPMVELDPSEWMFQIGRTEWPHLEGYEIHHYQDRGDKWIAKQVK